MALDFSEATVGSWVSALLDQRSRRNRVETKEMRSHANIAMVMFVIALILAFAGNLVPAGLAGFAHWALIASMLLGGGAGAAIRMVFERRYGVGPLVTPSIAVTIGLGSISGGMAGLLYLVAQPGNIDLTGNSGLRLISIRCRCQRRRRPDR